MKKLFLLLSAAVIASTAMAAPPKRVAGTGLRQTGSVIERTSAQRHKAVRHRAAQTEAIAVPFTHSLGKNEASVMANYTVIDANGDGRTWKPGGFTAYSVCMAPNDDNYPTSDDWMISPPIMLEGGKYYKVAFEEDMTLNRTEDLLEVKMGMEPTAEAMTAVVAPVHQIHYNDKVFQPKEYTIHVEEDGIYYIGFHALSEKAKSGTIKLCNFSMSEVAAPVVAPANAIETPVNHTLCKGGAEIDSYTVIDANGDGRTWKPGGMSTGSVCMKPTAEGINSADDWLVSVPVHLLPGVTYSVSIDAGSALTAGTKETVGIFAGKYDGSELTADKLTIPLLPTRDTQKRDMTEQKARFTVDEEGYYYVGIHCTSALPETGNLRVANLKIEEATGPEIYPPAAGQLSYVLAPQGELRATLTYTAPTLDREGRPLERLTKAVVTTNWAFTHEITDIVPGGTYTFDVTDIYNNGYNRFEAVAYIDDKAGEPVLITDVYAGNDNPLAPQNVRLQLSDDFRSVTVSWDPVGEVGENGGYVDTANVVYYIFDAFGSYYDPALASTTGTSYTFTYDDLQGQDFVAYQITAGVGETYYSLAANSDIITVGAPDAAPFFESFADCRYQNIWVVDPRSAGQSYEGLVYDNELQTNADAPEGTAPEYLNSQDADNGFYYWMPMEKDATYGFYSAKIDISALQNPVYEFWYQGKGSILDANIAVDGGELQSIKSINLRDEATEGWTRARIDLSPYKQSRYIQVGFLLSAVHNTDETTWSVPVDNIRVIDLKEKNVRLSSIGAPAKTSAGETVTVTASFENIGTASLNAVASLDVNGEATDSSELTAFAPGEVRTVSFAIPTSMLSPDAMTFGVTLSEGSQSLAEGSAATELTFPLFPGIDDLTAAADGARVNLSWNAPDFLPLTQPTDVTEDFENADYPMWTYSDFGGWHFIDGDRKGNYRFLQDVNNPYRTLPMAFQLFNAYESGCTPDQIENDCKPHSGNSMLVGWSCSSVNDNWAISPLLSGEAQTVSFWGKSFTIAYPESFEVYISDSDTALTSFTQVTDVTNYPANNQVPEDWTQFSFAVPAGTKYFAVRMTSEDTYALYLDDFQFRAPGVLPADTELQGYNVYVNDTKATETPSAATGYVYAAAEEAEYAFRVSAVYNHGESRASEPAAVTVETGVETILGDGVSVTAADGILTVRAAAGTAVSVATADGRLLHNGRMTADELRLTIPAGILLVTVDGRAYKLLLK